MPIIRSKFSPAQYWSCVEVLIDGFGYNKYSIAKKEGISLLRFLVKIITLARETERWILSIEPVSMTMELLRESFVGVTSL